MLFRSISLIISTGRSLFYMHFFYCFSLRHAIIHQVHELGDLLIGINRVATPLPFPSALGFFSCQEFFPNPKQSRVEVLLAVGVYFLLLGLKVCSRSRISSLSAVTSFHFFGIWHTNLYTSLVQSQGRLLTFQHLCGICSL